MDWITDLAALDALYPAPPSEAARVKVTPHLTPSYRAHIEASRFCILTTVGPEGTDGSPRGDEGPVVRILDARSLALPDWHGNNRIDSLRNILRDGRVSLLFLIPGCTTAMRVNGTARLTADPDLRASFRHNGKDPRSVIVIRIAEVYSQCARALIRSGLWAGIPARQGLPSVGDMLSDITAGRIDGAAYDAEWPERAAATMW